MTDKLFENKQLIIHVATECVILGGMAYYFSSQNKNLSARIEELEKTISEQNTKMQNMEAKLIQCGNAINILGEKVMGVVNSNQPVTSQTPQVQKVARRVVKTKTDTLKDTHRDTHRDTRRDTSKDVSTDQSEQPDISKFIKKVEIRPMSSMSSMSSVKRSVNEPLPPVVEEEIAISDVEDDEDLDAEISEEIAEVSRN